MKILAEFIFWLAIITGSIAAYMFFKLIKDAIALNNNNRDNNMTNDDLLRLYNDFNSKLSVISNKTQIEELFIEYTEKKCNIDYLTNSSEYLDFKNKMINCKQARINIIENENTKRLNEGKIAIITNLDKDLGKEPVKEHQSDIQNQQIENDTEKINTINIKSLLMNTENRINEFLDDTAKINNIKLPSYADLNNKYARLRKYLVNNLSVLNKIELFINIKNEINEPQSSFIYELRYHQLDEINTYFSNK